MFLSICSSDVKGKRTFHCNIYEITKKRTIKLNIITAIGHRVSRFNNKVTLGIANQTPIHDKYATNKLNCSDVYFLLNIIYYYI